MIKDMARYRVDITEVLSKEITVEACSHHEAYEKAKCLYRNCEVVLSADDLSDVDFRVEEELSQS